MLTSYENKLVYNVVKREKLFLILSILGVIVALLLAVYYSWKAYTQVDFEKSIHYLVVVLILLNARQNLRQHHYAKVLRKLLTNSAND